MVCACRSVMSIFGRQAWVHERDAWRRTTLVYSLERWKTCRVVQKTILSMSPSKSDTKSPEVFYSPEASNNSGKSHSPVSPLEALDSSSHDKDTLRAAGRTQARQRASTISHLMPTRSPRSRGPSRPRSPGLVPRPSPSSTA